ncbi:hypothetical protein, partial [Schaalia suimastitidis]|uniref:hypothetical protein n=1 Tax=Schaalia suimastitidis TaxID=121163 RepID=UPI00103B2F6F
MVSLSLSHTVGSLLFDHPDSFFSARGNRLRLIFGTGITYTLHERDGLFELDSYERWEPPQVFARATHIDDMLRHIITIAGDAYRERRNYLYIRLPYRTPKP